MANRSWNEAYCIANPGLEYAVFFPDGGNVLLKVSEAAPYRPVKASTGRSLTVHWLDIRKTQWVGRESAAELEQVGPDTFLRLITPTEEGYWAALIKT